MNTAFGYGVVTCQHFTCKKGDIVFCVRDCIPVPDEQRDIWDGYIFDASNGVSYIPNHPFEENKVHPPIMVNTHCIEKKEIPNLKLFDHNTNVIIFEATRRITGGQTLLVKYSGKYNKELQIERSIARRNAECARYADMSSRPNKSFSRQCHLCGHQCQPKFFLKHYNLCKIKK